MSKYTKLEDAINEMTRLSKEQIERTGYDTAPIIDIVDILANLPTTEIVRCADCKYNPHDIGWIHCPMTGENTRKPNDFCSYGERIDNE